MRFERQKLPLTCNQRRRTLPVRISWKGDWTSGVSLRCESASRGQKFSKSKNFSTFFKTCSLHVSGLWDNSKRKKFSEFQTNLSPDIAMKFERQKLPLTCNQRRRTLPVRITWKGDWTSGVSSRFSKSNNFS